MDMLPERISDGLWIAVPQASNNMAMIDQTLFDNARFRDR
jgi:hypothetical protein